MYTYLYHALLGILEEHAENAEYAYHEMQGCIQQLKVYIPSS